MIMTSLTGIFNYLIIQLYDICSLSNGWIYAISGTSDVLNHLIIH